MKRVGPGRDKKDHRTGHYETYTDSPSRLLWLAAGVHAQLIHDPFNYAAGVLLAGHTLRSADDSWAITDNNRCLLLYYPHERFFLTDWYSPVEAAARWPQMVALRQRNHGFATETEPAKAGTPNS